MSQANYPSKYGLYIFQEQKTSAIERDNWCEEPTMYEELTSFIATQS
jgi:hypothetical protein